MPWLPRDRNARLERLSSSKQYVKKPASAKKIRQTETHVMPNPPIDESSDSDSGEIRQSESSYKDLLGKFAPPKPELSDRRSIKRRKLTREDSQESNSNDGSQVRVAREEPLWAGKDNEGHTRGSNHLGSDPSNLRKDRKDAGHEEHADDFVENESGDSSENDKAGTSEDSFYTHFGDRELDEIYAETATVDKGKWHVIRPQLSKLERWEVHIPGEDMETTVGSLPHRTLPRLQGKNLKQSLKADSAALQRQSILAGSLFSYQDILFCGKTPRDSASFRHLAGLHCINHIFKTRSRVLKNNTKIMRQRNEGGPEVEVRDQGFTRPKVLILLETRNACYQYMEEITKIVEPEQEENKKRFQDAFYERPGKFSDTRPEDFRELFDGNHDNEFKVGIKFTRKTIKYYSQFYSSDIILASPLGLRRVIDAAGPKKGNDTSSDFLSSIEILLIDQAEAMQMQNWTHVMHVIENTNLQPKGSHGCDFSRVRRWYLEGLARNMRQTVVFSAYNTPQLNSLFSTHLKNIAGKSRHDLMYPGSMLEVDLGRSLPQKFRRLLTTNVATEPERRLEFFKSTMLPSLMKRRDAFSDSTSLGVLIFVSSYFDYLRLRRVLVGSSNAEDLTDAVQSNLSVGCLDEYTDHTTALRVRSHFNNGKHDIVLYTGRVHHFRRTPRIRGVKELIFYSLPENPRFYPELVSYLEQYHQETGKGLVRAIFSKYEGLALERIVGSKRMPRMLGLDSRRGAADDIFDFE